jgi:hypothetical protein
VVSRCGRSLGGWAGPRRRSLARYAANGGAGRYRPVAPRGRRGVGFVDSSRRSWRTVSGSAGWWRPSSSCVGHLSRSRVGWLARSPTSRRCGCPTKRSTWRCSCRPVAPCAKNSPATCGHTGGWAECLLLRRCGGRELDRPPTLDGQSGGWTMIAATRLSPYAAGLAARSLGVSAVGGLVVLAVRADRGAPGVGWPVMCGAEAVASSSLWAGRRRPGRTPSERRSGRSWVPGAVLIRVTSKAS